MRTRPQRRGRVRTPPLWVAYERCGVADRELVDCLLLQTLLADALTREPAGERRARLVSEYKRQEALNESRVLRADRAMRREAQDSPTRRRAGSKGGRARPVLE